MLAALMVYFWEYKFDTGDVIFSWFIRAGVVARDTKREATSSGEMWMPLVLLIGSRGADMVV